MVSCQTITSERFVVNLLNSADFIGIIYTVDRVNVSNNLMKRLKFVTSYILRIAHYIPRACV